jgi:8-oxo-dGTP diphosphatase
VATWKYVSEHPIFSVTADLVVLTVRAEALCVLLIKRGGEPFKGALALPGGFVRESESLVDAAYRELEEESSVRSDHVVLEQLATYGDPDRDPRGRVVTVAFLALAANVPEPVAGSDAAAAMWLPVEEVLAGSHGRLAFDHRRILGDGLERARAKIEYTGLAAAFCGPEFTLGELRRVYELVWGQGRVLDPANFQRKVLGIEGYLHPTGNMRRDGRGRPSRTYRADPQVELWPPFTRRSP